MAQKTGSLRKVTTWGGRVREPSILWLIRTGAVASGGVRSARLREETFWGPGRVASWRGLAAAVALSERSQPVCG